MQTIRHRRGSVPRNPARRIRHRSILAALLVASLALVVVPAGVATAGPHEVVDEPRIYVFEDGTNAFLWNTTRAPFCSWEAGGFQGDAPAIEPVPVRYHETGNGVVMVSFQATRSLEVWRLSPGEDLGDLCDLPDGATPWATGEARLTNTDNDWDISGTRAASWGYRGQGAVSDVDGGAWRVSWVSKSLVRPDGSFDNLVYRSQVTRTGPR